MSLAQLIRKKFSTLFSFFVLIFISLFFFLPSTALAVDVVTLWSTPGLNQNFQFTDDIVLNGNWSLPPDWLGNIYIFQDGIQIHDSAHPGANCSLIPAPEGCYIPITNVGGTESLMGAFLFNIGNQPDGTHSLQIKFWGGKTCAVKAELNANQTPPPYELSETCAVNDDNFNGGQIYPLRYFTVDRPLYPRFSVTPTDNPALDFLNVTTGGQVTKTFLVSNTGQQALSFTMTGLTAPYYCVGSSCTQVVGNTPKFVSVQFVPETIGTFPGTVVFNCMGAPLPCDVPSITRTITGNGIGAPLPPKVTVVSGSPLDFGSFYLGNPTYVDRNIVIKNTGGGLLNGSIGLPGGEYTCLGNCNYSLFAGDIVTKTIRFTPNSASSTRADTAFLSDATVGATTTLKSSVSDTPVLRACVSGCPGTWTGSVWNGIWDVGAKVNIGDHREIALYVQNTGGGKLSGVLTDLPERGFTFIPNGNYPFTNITSAMNWVNIGVLRFDPADALPADAYPVLSNDTPLGGNTNTLHLYGQGNDQAISGGDTEVQFGSVVLATTKTKTLFVQNTGVGVLNVNISSGVLSNPVFSCDNNCSIALGKGESKNITFSFTPSALGLTSLVIDVGGKNVTLKGSGIQPHLLAEAYDSLIATWRFFPLGTPVEYGTTYFGSPVQNKSLDLYLNSNGGANTRVNFSIDTSASPHFRCIGSYCSGTISVDNPFWYEAWPKIEFQPGNAPGGPDDYTEIITINYDYGVVDPTPRQLTYQAHGTSISSPHMTITPVAHSYAWPPTVVGNSPTTIFTVHSDGIGPLTGFVGIPNSGDLAGLWTLNNTDIDWGTSKAFDSSGNVNTGSFIGTPTSVVGHFGEALHFVSGQGVDLGTNSSAFNFGDVSGATWIKTSTNGRMILAYQNGTPLIYLSVGATTAGGTANRFVVYLRTNGGGVAVFSSTKVINDNLWHHVAFVRSAATKKVKLFVDGVLDSTFTYNDVNSISTSGGVHYIASLGSGSYQYSGDVDDVRMYSRALSTSEINQLYNGAVVVNNSIFKCINPSPCEFNNLASGDTMDVKFSFSPTDEFYYSATPLFTSDGGNINVSLSGTGVYQPVIKLTPDTITDPSTYVVTYDFLDLGESNLGTYVEKNVRVWNVGRGPLNGNITFTTGLHFSCQPPAVGCVFTVPENGYQDVTIRFAPLGIDGLDDFAKFTSNAFNNPQTIQVHGIGVFKSIINILGSGQSFGSVVIGKQKDQKITIKNTGTVDFGTGFFGIAAPFACVASTVGPLVGGLCPYQLDADGTTVITVRFKPTVVGTFSGQVSLSTLPLANFFVNGMGIYPSIHYIEQ